jgi:Na+/H+ antiporter NhaD/arsenite permease-like protein
MSFGEYLRRASLGGVLAILVVIPLLPVLMRDIWRSERPLPPRRAGAKLKRPVYAALAIAVLALMMVLFVLGEDLPTRIVPPVVAMIAGALALLVGYAFKVEPTDRVLRDVDWKTLLFLACIFCLVQGMAKTGLLQVMSLKLYEVFGTRVALVALAMICGIGLLSSVLANVPVAAASIVMVKGYLVMAEFVPESAMSDQFTQWPPTVMPIFIGMMYGATLGGNATLVGSAANIVAVGICTQEGAPVSFGRFLRYGLPFTVLQLAVAAVYVLVLERMLR